MIKLLTIISVVTGLSTTTGTINQQSQLHNVKYNHVGSYVIPYTDTDKTGDYIIIIENNSEYITHVNLK